MVVVQSSSRKTQEAEVVTRRGRRRGADGKNRSESERFTRSDASFLYKQEQDSSEMLRDTVQYLRPRLRERSLFYSLP